MHATIKKYNPPSQSIQIATSDKRITTLIVGGPELIIQSDEGTFHRFEMHGYFGPIPLGKNGDALKKIPESFWDAFERWELGGKFVEGENCVVPAWCNKCGGHGKSIKHLGGKQYEVIGKCEECDGYRIVGEQFHARDN